MLGPRSLSHTICDHITFFERLREEGATWEQIASLMESEGLRSRRGNAVSAGVLRALFSRAMKTDDPEDPKLIDLTDKRGPDEASDCQPNKLSKSGTYEPCVDTSLAQIIERAARLRGVERGEKFP